ncbi:inovirus Gp2 family protein [Morganella morganii]|uniref:YagK/YfjJ domain-containing protein n=1 Tax=Morganella morganii TaxID=582 RepID=UPI00339BE131
MNQDKLKINDKYEFNEKYKMIVTDKLYSSLEMYKRIYVVRFDLRFPVIINDDCDDGIYDYSVVKNNKVITRFFSSVKSKIKAELNRRYSESMKKYKAKLIKHKPRRYEDGMRYVWVKEIGEESERKHYHVLMFFNKDCFFNCNISSRLQRIIDSAWNSALGLSDEIKLVHYCFFQYENLSIYDDDLEEKKKIMLDYYFYLTKEYTKTYDVKERSIGYSKQICNK